MIFPDETTPLPPEDDVPPFSPPHTCPSCHKPYVDHKGLTKLCQDRENLLVVLKATAINTFEIHQMLVKVISHMESPQTEKHPKSGNSPLQEGLES